MAGIYIHIPYCKQACSYCNFHFSTLKKGKKEMIKAMKQELFLRKDYLEGEVLETIYFGGGTPSIIGQKAIEELLNYSLELFPTQNIKEITLEANPDDLTADFLKFLKKSPVNRLSVGVQSFIDRDLQMMNRAHTAKESLNAIKMAQDYGFENISLDLIYGIPEASLKEWQYNIQQACLLEVPHISAYCLTVEPKTVLSDMVKKYKLKIPEDKIINDQFDMLCNSLEEAKYQHYEISNFAKKGQMAVHNTNYWKGEKYLGIGPSAHSYNGESRQWNIANNTLYYKNILEDNKLIYEKEILSMKEKWNEYIFISLRTIWGIDLQKVKNQFGKEAYDKMMNQAQIYLVEGKLEIKIQNLRLTQKGKLFADGIAADFFEN